MGQVAFGYAQAVVAHAQAHIAAGLLGLQAHLALRAVGAQAGRVLHGVVQQYHQHLLYAVVVAQHRRQAVRRVHREYEVAVLGLGAVLFGQILQQRAQTHLLQLERELPALQAAQLHQVAYQSAQAHGLAHHYVVVSHARGLVAHHAVAQRLYQPAQGGERRAHLVRYVGHVFAPGLLQALGLGYVAEERHRAHGVVVAVLYRRYRQAQYHGRCARRRRLPGGHDGYALVAHYQLARYGRARGDDALEVIKQALWQGVAQRVDVPASVHGGRGVLRLVLRAGGLNAEQPAHGRVGVGYRALGVHGDYALAYAVEYLQHAVALHRQVGYGAAQLLRHVVERAAQLAHLVALGYVGAGGEVTLRHLEGHVAHLAHGAAYVLGHVVGQRRGQQQHRAHGYEQRQYHAVARGGYLHLRLEQEQPAHGIAVLNYRAANGQHVYAPRGHGQRKHDALAAYHLFQIGAQQHAGGDVFGHDIAVERFARGIDQQHICVQQVGVELLYQPHVGHVVHAYAALSLAHALGQAVLYHVHYVGQLGLQLARLDVFKRGAAQRHVKQRRHQRVERNDYRDQAQHAAHERAHGANAALHWLTSNL